jgi:hypothetical protein
MRAGMVVGMVDACIQYGRVFMINALWHVSLF